ncbi:MAG: hypothetical protein WC759_03635, partial [Candidatus Micrarchaeia archaeon]
MTTIAATLPRPAAGITLIRQPGSSTSFPRMPALLERIFQSKSKGKRKGRKENGAQKPNVSSAQPTPMQSTTFSPAKKPPFSRSRLLLVETAILLAIAGVAGLFMHNKSDSTVQPPVQKPVPTASAGEKAEQRSFARTLFEVLEARGTGEFDAKTLDDALGMQSTGAEKALLET